MKFIKPYIFLRRSDDAGLITPRSQYYDSVYAPSVYHNNPSAIRFKHINKE